MALTKTTKLQAVNIILSNIGQAPVTTLDSVNPMVATAENILDEVSRSVQGEGWSFNTERGYPVPVQADGKVPVPANVLSFDCDFNSSKIVISRNGYLYDKLAHTDKFTEKSLSLDVVWLFGWDDLPEAARSYISIRAANVFAGRVVGSSEAVRFGDKQEQLARAELLEHETQQGDYSMFMGPDGNNPIRTYTPIQVISRY